MLTALSLLIAPALAGNEPAWSGFRGNNGTGLAVEGTLPLTLDPEESARWRVEVPAGYSSPVVGDELVYLTGAEGTQLITLAIDRATGEEVWRRVVEYDGSKVGQNSSAAPSPVLDEERVYVLFHHAGLVAYGHDGEEHWRRPFEPFNIPHGMSSSPVVHGDRLILLVDQDQDPYLLAVDKRTGEDLWKVRRPGVTHSYSTPALYEPAEGPAQVIVAGSFQVRAYSVEDGAQLWAVDGSSWQTKSVPLVVGDRCYVSAYMVAGREIGLPPTAETWIDELVERDLDGDERISREEWSDNRMLSSAWFVFDLNDDGFLEEDDWEFLRASHLATGGLIAIDLAHDGEDPAGRVLWRYEDRRGLPDCPSPLLVGDTLFLIKEGSLLTALDAATGEVTRQERVGQPGPYFASPVAAGDRLLTVSTHGQLAVLSASPEWEVLSLADIGEECWSTPALAGGQAFVRSQEALWCFESSAE